jgi:two-component system chemotaxis response regulator CheY
MCSALKEKPKVLEALQAGARDYILKPVKPERVLEAVEKVLM